MPPLQTHRKSPAIINLTFELNDFYDLEGSKHLNNVYNKIIYNIIIHGSRTFKKL